MDHEFLRANCLDEILVTGESYPDKVDEKMVEEL